MKNFPIKLRWSVTVVILIVGALPFLNLTAFGQGAAPGGNPVVPYATAVPAPIDLKTAAVTVYTQVDGHSLVTWNTLAHFEYDAPSIDEEIDANLRLRKKKYPIPGFIKSLSGTPVAVVGFMIPLETNDTGDKATSFILARSQATCCYGITPKMNEWVFVTMKKGKQADAVMDIPVTAFGVLSVGEEKQTDTGWSLYRMSSDKVAVPQVNW